ncbi:MAG TPA: zinc dependent phospholipase C family protein [Anaerolineales bacterium]|nr:zinc dependent phospholipase C family protein [Anaerolineales bacterium]
MPGPGTHILVSDKVKEKLGEMEGWNFSAFGESPNPTLPSNFAKIITANPNYYALGAVGPDFFFFLPDFRNHLASPLIGVVHFLYDAYAKLDKWILEDWETYFGPVGENVEEAISRLTGDLSSVVGEVLGELSSLLSTALLDLVTQSHDWWGLFSLGLDIGFDNKDFFWSDMLHYRQTSLFAHNLWVIAEEWAARPEDDAALWSDRLKAYALGYITHVATDATGHAFVNEKCGGPFRTHWQRHHLIENHMDAKTYDDEYGDNQNYNMFTKSALHYRIAFGDDGGKPQRTLPPYDSDDDSIRGRYIWRRRIDLDSHLPEELATLLFEAMDRTYDTSKQASDHSISRTSPDIITGGDGRPTVTTIQDTYQTLFDYLKMSTLDGFSHEKPTPPEEFPNLDFPLLTDPHDDPPDEADEDMSFGDWVLSALRFILWLLAVAVWLATVLPGAALDLLTYPARVEAYYTIELPLFLMVKAERAVMVMTGYFHPMKDEIDMGLVQIGNNNHGNFLDLLASVDDILGTGLEVGQATTEPVPDAHFPHQTKFEETGPLDTLLNKSSEEYHHPWDYPETPLELCHTFAGPWQGGDLPHKLLENAIATDEYLVEKYATAADPFETDIISFTEVTAEQNLGDPVNFSSFLIWQLARRDVEHELPNWNLDADRGYGYRCWDWNRQTKDGASLSDTEGHQYLAPCTPPPQTEEIPGYNPDVPLKIYYLDKKNPGCDKDVQCPDVKRKRQGEENLTFLLRRRGR